MLIIAVILVVLVVYWLFKEKPNDGKQKNNSFMSTESKTNEFFAIKDQYKTLEDVTEGLRKAGLESSNLIIGIDYTASNFDTGRQSFNGKSLHHIQADAKNPYQQVISIVGRTLEKLDEDKVIPAFGFGDMTTKDFAVFPFTPDPYTARYCHGFEEVLSVYNNITPHIKLSGPTNWAPIIFKAIEIVKESGRAQYHILIIITDGQVVNEKETIDAIVQATNYPLSIICIGVGDGPWEMMEEFDDGLPQRKFDNFQFVNFTDILKEKPSKFDVAFAVAALQEIPDQYKAIRKLGLLGS